MKCIDVKENLDAFLDAEIETSRKKKIESHLEDCLLCRTEFESLQTVGDSLRQNLFAAAPPALDDKILSAFENFHSQKRNVRAAEKREKIGWFGIPRFAFAAALALFALTAVSAFQIGRMSAGEISIVLPQEQEIRVLPDVEQAKDEKIAPVKIVEVPVIKEKIVEVPVIKTRTIYVEKENKSVPNAPAKDNFALKSSIEKNGYLTKTDLKDFQPVSEFKLKINKEDKLNEQ